MYYSSSYRSRILTSFMTKFFRFCIYFLLTFTCCAQAAQVAGLYEAELPVESADTSALPESFRLGLQKVLVKITGRKMCSAVQM